MSLKNESLNQNKPLIANYLATCVGYVIVYKGEQYTGSPSFVHYCTEFFITYFHEEISIMGRAVKFDREAAVETCMHDMWRFGYEACSVKSISEKLGITRSSFYNAFGSREALFLEVLKQYAEHIPSKSLNTASRYTPIKRLLTDFFRDICHSITSDPEARGCLGVNSIAELVGVDEKLGPVVKGAILHSFERFERLLEVASVKGEIIDDGQLRSKALSLQSLVLGLSMMSKVIYSYDDLKAVADLTLKGLDLFEEEQTLDS